MLEIKMLNVMNNQKSKLYEPNKKYNLFGEDVEHFYYTVNVQAS